MIRSYSVTLIDDDSGAATLFTVDGNMTSLDFLDLHPAYTYSLELAATTTSQGPLSDTVRVEMAEDSKSIMSCCCKLGQAFFHARSRVRIMRVDLRNY